MCSARSSVRNLFLGLAEDDPIGVGASRERHDLAQTLVVPVSRDRGNVDVPAPAGVRRVRAQIEGDAAFEKSGTAPDFPQDIGIGRALEPKIEMRAQAEKLALRAPLNGGLLGRDQPGIVECGREAAIERRDDVPEGALFLLRRAVVL